MRVADRELSTERIVVATGSRATFPPIDGLEALDELWTSREGTTASEVPERLIVLGGGPVGCELAQAWARLGARVTLVEAAERLLLKEPEAASARIRRALEADGVDVRVDTAAEAADRDGDGYVLTLPGGEELAADRILLAAGRRPRTDGLGLERAGVELGEDGAVRVDDRMRAADGVWAVGDVTGIQPFTHVGNYQGRIAVADIRGQEARADYRAIPRVTFTDPPVASVGVSEAEQSAYGDLSVLARGAAYVAEGRDDLGFLVLFSDGEVLTGACAVGPEAGEWLGQLNLAVSARIPVAQLREVVQPFLTFSEIVPRTLAKLA